MNEKRLEPTDAMVTDTLEAKYQLNLTSVRSILRVGLNHPDAAGLLAAEWKANAEAAAERAERAEEALAERERTNTPDGRPWEPLNGDPVRVGDEVRQDLNGITTTAVVGRLDGGGDPWSAEGALIGLLYHGIWHVRRPVQELPEEDGAVIVPADGCQFIETRTGKKSRRLTWDAECLVWYDARGTHLYGDITTGTWKVDDQ